MGYPRNVRAVLDWYRSHMPDQVRHVESLFERDRACQHAGLAGTFASLLLQGFEAGREFERAHPEVESGVGYLQDEVAGGR